MKAGLGAILVVAVLVLAGCGGGGGGGDDNGGGNVVKITDNGFEPSTLTIKSGDTVRFENDSSDDAWPASNVHPTHLTKVGSWGYHNHLEPDTQGTIVVK